MDKEYTFRKYRELCPEDKFPGNLVCLTDYVDSIIIIREVIVKEYATP